MTNDLQDPIGRIVWRDGQVLASRDLRAELQEELRHRSLHNRYMHATWGIAFGFGVNVDQGGARVIVAPGYAIDVEGRDLLLAEALPIAPPFEDGTFILAASYGEPSCDCRTTLPDADFCIGPDPRRDRATLTWAAATEINFGVHVPLARATFVSGQVQGILDLHVRRYARRNVRSHIAQGITQAGSSLWMDVSVPKHPDFWLQADVDTSDAGFVNIPRYLATLCRQEPARRQPRSGSLDESAAVLGKQPALTLDGIGCIVQATPTRFTYRLPRGKLPFGADLTAAEAEAGGWVIAWVGIEKPGADQLQVDLGPILAGLGGIL